MQAVILHLPGAKIDAIKKGLIYENIETISKSWKVYSPTPHAIGNADAVILYCEQPNSLLLKLIPAIRKKKNSIPIAVVDATEKQENKNLAEAKECDFYYSLPFSYRILALRLKNLLYRHSIKNGDKWMRAWNIRLDLEHRFVRRDNQVIPLRNKEFALLEYFMINRGKLVTRTSLLDYVWDRNVSFASNTVDVHVNRLRKKIDDPFRHKFIHTVHCIGYIFDKQGVKGKK